MVLVQHLHMPKRSRGFWVCEYCEVTFDHFEEAQFHELQQQCGMVPREEEEAQQQQQQQQVNILTETTPQPWTCPLVASNEAIVTLKDELETCRSLEFYTMESDRNIVALRCVYCKEAAEAPSNVASIGGTIRQLSQHIISCPRVPMDSRNVIRLAIQKRENNMDDTLTRFGVSRCEELGLVNQIPTGIMVGKQGALPTWESMTTCEPIPQVDSNFPYFQVPNGDWYCKYCYHVPPSYREEHFFWSSPNKQQPPSHSFVHFHLSQCREYNRMAYQYHQRQAYYTEYPTTTAGYSPQQSPPVSSRRESSRSPYYDTNPLPASAPSPFEQQDEFSQLRQNLRTDLEPLLPSATASDVDAISKRSIDYLTAHDMSTVDNDGNAIPDESLLVIDEDRLLLTDYFFFVMKQLRLVKFSEKDRRTRGGKRENIIVGYGGLQCVHCATTSNARKFFWGNVDRLANSFAEIPGHILKCKHCPEETKTALLDLKKNHPKQMSRLPRGSQKIFFRRMWRRLHREEEEADANEETSAAPSLPSPLDTKLPASANDSHGSSSISDESFILFERPSHEAAKALSDASMQAGPPSPSSRVVLAIPEDKQWLSDTDCFVRRQIEVFCATKDDIKMSQVDRKFGISEGQVGIRCLHCAMTSHGARRHAVSYPFTIQGIYEAVREFQRAHLEECSSLPTTTKSKLERLKGATSLSSVLRKYFVLSAKALGLKDTKDGIRAGAESIPVGQQASFSFSDVDDGMNRKRKSSDDNVLMERKKSPRTSV